MPNTEWLPFQSASVLSDTGSAWSNLQNIPGGDGQYITNSLPPSGTTKFLYIGKPSGFYYHMVL